jgi:acetolactate synthase regulatory subunit
MSSTLNVRIRRAEGCLLRLLGQIGRRGYEVLGVTARLTSDQKSFDVVIDFEPLIPLAPGKPRPVEVLPALVSKLVDVEKVELAPVTQKPPSESIPERMKR